MKQTILILALALCSPELIEVYQPNILNSGPEYPISSSAFGPEKGCLIPKKDKLKELNFLDSIELDL